MSSIAGPSWRACRLPHLPAPTFSTRRHLSYAPRTARSPLSPLSPLASSFGPSAHRSFSHTAVRRAPTESITTIPSDPSAPLPIPEPTIFQPLSEFLLAHPLPTYAASIILLTILLRTTLTLPLLQWQISRQRRIGMLVKPEFEKINREAAMRLFREFRLQGRSREEYQSELAKQMHKVQQDLLVKHNARPLTTMLGPMAVNVPLLIIFSSTIHGAIDLPGSAMAAESFLWISRLGEPDVALGLLGGVILMGSAEMSAKRRGARAAGGGDEMEGLLEDKSASAAAGEPSSQEESATPPHPGTADVRSATAKSTPGPPRPPQSPRAPPSRPVPPRAPASPALTLRQFAPSSASSPSSDRSPARPSPSASSAPPRSTGSATPPRPRRFSTSTPPLQAPPPFSFGPRRLPRSQSPSPSQAREAPPEILEDLKAQSSVMGSGMQAVLQSQFMTAMQRVGAVLLVAFATQMPAGVVLYWTTSVTYTFAQNLLLPILARRKREKAKALRLRAQESETTP